MALRPGLLQVWVRDVASVLQDAIGRDPNPHLGFGFGPHFCLGRHLAALELRVLLHAVAQRIPEITLDGLVARLRSYWMNGIKHMPVKFPAAG